MPKLKTHQGTAKRVRKTSTGKLVHRRAFTHHKLQQQSSSRKRRLSISASVHDSNQSQVRQALGKS